MTNSEENINLLKDLIHLSVIDGELHDKEMDFIAIIATSLYIDKKTVYALFEKREPAAVIKSEFDRIVQFYRLALLMFTDGVLHNKEHQKLFEIGIKMGLNPQAMKVLIQKMESAPNTTINPTELIALFQIHHN